CVYFVFLFTSPSLAGSASIPSFFLRSAYASAEQIVSVSGFLCPKINVFPIFILLSLSCSISHSKISNLYFFIYSKFYHNLCSCSIHTKHEERIIIKIYT